MNEIPWTDAQQRGGCTGRPAFIVHAPRFPLESRIIAGLSTGPDSFFATRRPPRFRRADARFGRRLLRGGRQSERFVSEDGEPRDRFTRGQHRGGGAVETSPGTRRRSRRSRRRFGRESRRKGDRWRSILRLDRL